MCLITVCLGAPQRFWYHAPVDELENVVRPLVASGRADEALARVREAGFDVGGLPKLVDAQAYAAAGRVHRLAGALNAVGAVDPHLIDEIREDPWLAPYTDDPRIILSLGSHRDIDKAFEALRFREFGQAAELLANPDTMSHPATAWMLRSVCHMSRGEFDAGIEACRHLIELLPSMPDGWFNLASAHEARGEQDAAVEAYERLVAIEPEHASGWCNLGLLRRQREDLPGSLDALSRACEVAPGNPFFWFKRAEAAALIGDPGLAESSLREAAKLDPGVLEALGDSDIFRKAFDEERYERLRQG